MAYSYPHMCRDDHVEIGHKDSEHELCPFCRLRSLAEYQLEKLPGQIADWLAEQYPDNVNTNAFCAAIRNYSAEQGKDISDEDSSPPTAQREGGR
jgi:hypothetical protein